LNDLDISDQSQDHRGKTIARSQYTASCQGYMLQPAKADKSKKVHQ